MRTTSYFGSRVLVMLALAGGLALAAGDASGQKTTTSGQAQAKATTQPQQNQPSHIQTALHELKHARRQLHEAKHNFGGHKEEAVRAVDHAIHQLELIVQHEAQNHKK